MWLRASCAGVSKAHGGVPARFLGARTGGIGSPCAVTGGAGATPLTVGCPPPPEQPATAAASTRTTGTQRITAPAGSNMRHWLPPHFDRLPATARERQPPFPAGSRPIPVSI